ncbi:MAG: hypothetical protein U0836_24505 [Pirellulales bacterium]
MSRTQPLGDVSWERMIEAVEAVRERLARATEALTKSGVPHAVVGGNAVAAWVSRVDRAAVRNTQDVDLLLDRGDLPAAIAALATVGFVSRHVKSVERFLDGEGAKARDAVHVVFAGEKVRADCEEAAPRVEQSELSGGMHVLSLEPLVRMKLTSFRDKDRMHLRDLIEVGLVDREWPNRLPESLAKRLQELLDTPDG